MTGRVALGAAEAPKSSGRVAVRKNEMLAKCKSLSSIICHYGIDPNELLSLTYPVKDKTENSRSRRLERRRKARFDKEMEDPNFRSSFGRFKKQLFPYAYKEPSHNVSGRKRRKMTVKDALADAYLVSFPDINIIDSHYKHQYLKASQSVPLFVNKDQFVLVPKETELYSEITPHLGRPHPNVKQYLKKFVAKRMMRAHGRAPLVQQQDIEIERLLNHDFGSVHTSSYKSLVESKIIRKEKITSSVIQKKRAGKKRPSRMKRAAAYKLYGPKFIHQKSQAKRRKQEKKLTIRSKRKSEDNDRATYKRARLELGLDGFDPDWDFRVRYGDLSKWATTDH